MSAPRPASVREYAPLARARLSDAAWHYLHDGDDGDNERALAAWCVLPRPLADVRGGSTCLDLFGHALEHPILLAPVAHHRLFHPDAEIATAAAAAAQGGQSIVSSLASRPFADVARAAREVGGPPPWFQLYWQGDRPRTARLLERALAAGLSHVVFTVDAPVKRATLVLPKGVSAVNLEPEVVRAPVGDGGSEVFDGWMARAPTWGDVEWLRTQLPDRRLLLKGILHPDDAQRALDAGCDGLVVSNHGGRVLPAAPASAVMLPAIAQRVGGPMPILFDGGVRSGTDVFVALALGASAVLVGRPPIWGLAAGGALGVAHVIRLLRDELEMTMALAGCAGLDAVTSARVIAPPGRRGGRRVGPRQGLETIE